VRIPDAFICVWRLLGETLQQLLGAPFKPSFGLSGIRALNVPLRSGLLCELMIRSERQAIRKASASAIKSGFHGCFRDV
jgi:hypothetical protein